MSVDPAGVDAPDSALITDFLNGDERAFRTLYRRHTPRLRMTVLRLVGYRDADADAEAHPQIISETAASGNGGRGGRSAGGAGTGVTDTVVSHVIDPDSLADYRPPFAPRSPSDALVGAMLADADGNVWILPTPEVPLSPDPGPVYDVVSRAGKLIDRVHVTPGFGIVGFSPGYVFMSIREGATTVLVKAKIR